MAKPPPNKAIFLQHFSLDTLVGWVERSETQQSQGNVGLRKASTQPTSSQRICYISPNTVQLRKLYVGWVERSETQQSQGNVGFRSSTQPT